MTKLHQRYLALTLGVATIMILVLLPRETNVISHSVEISSVGDEAMYKSSLTDAGFGMLGFHLFESNEGRKHWNIQSKFAELRRAENYAYMKEVVAKFHAERTGNIVETTSRYGRSLIDKHLVELEGEVSIRSKKGYLFEMNRLTYNGTNHEFTSKDTVEMKGPNVDRPAMLLRGTGLLAHIDEEHFYLKKQVSAQRRLRGSGWMKVNSQSGEFFTDEQRAVFLGRVKAVLPRSNIRSDLFEVSASDEMEFLSARGNVHLEQRGRFGKAESALLELGSNKITLEGNAELDSKGNIISGRRIVLYTDEEKIWVEEAQGRVQEQ